MILSNIPSHFLYKLAVDDSDDTDYYRVLSIPRDASTAEIKAAYHRALLHFHPDKRHINRPSSEAEPRPIEISLIKEAYATLSVPESRSAYGGLLLNRERGGGGGGGRPGFAGSRPAQVVSLEEFRVVKPEASRETEDNETNEWEEYTYPCRCGGMYRLRTHDLESGHHLIGCENCSEVIWVGYEEVVE